MSYKWRFAERAGVLGADVSRNSWQETMANKYSKHKRNRPDQRPESKPNPPKYGSNKEQNQNGS
jgi:hypothetical protein